MTLIAYVRANPEAAKPTVPEGWTAPEPSWRRIIRETADKHGVTAEQILTPRPSGHVKNKPTAWFTAAPARQEAAWRMRNELNMSFPAIARRLRMKNHTSVIYSCRRVEAAMAEAAQ